MAHGSRICPQCGGLNGIDEKTCFRCGKRLPGPISGAVGGIFTDFSADGLVMTKVIAVMCIIVYVLVMAGDGGFKLDFSIVARFRTSTLLRYGILVVSPELIAAEPWRFLSACFLHLGLLHIGFNLMSLANLGSTLEPHFGSARFLILYVLTGILGFLTSWWWYAGEFPPVPTAGASGAIFGLVGAFVGVLLARRNPGFKRALVNNLIFAAIIGFAMPRTNTAAHLGGFAAGIVIGALFELERKPRTRDGLMRVLAGLCLVGCVASIVLCVRSPRWKEVRMLEEAQRTRANSR